MEDREEMLVDQSERQPTEGRGTRPPLEALRIQSSAGADVPRSPQHRGYRRQCCQSLELYPGFAG